MTSRELQNFPKIYLYIIDLQNYDIISKIEVFSYDNNANANAAFNEDALLEY